MRLWREERGEEDMMKWVMGFCGSEQDVGEKGFEECGEDVQEEGRKERRFILFKFVTRSRGKKVFPQYRRRQSCYKGTIINRTEQEPCRIVLYCCRHLKAALLFSSVQNNQRI